jgi:hypothetical protein
MMNCVHQQIAAQTGDKPMRWFYALLDISLTSLLVLALLGACLQPADAYVDPGSGLFALQILSTTCAGMVFMLRRRLREFYRRIATSFETKSEKPAKL